MNSWFEQKIKWIKDRFVSGETAQEVQPEVSVPEVSEVQAQAEEVTEAAPEVQPLESAPDEPLTQSESVEAEAETVKELCKETETVGELCAEAETVGELCTDTESSKADTLAETEPCAQQAEAEPEQPDDERSKLEAEPEQADTEKIPGRKKVNWVYIAGTAVCVGVLALVLWGTSGRQSVSGDVTTELSTEIETEAPEVLRMAVVSAGYIPLLELDDFDPENDLVHISYETMKESLLGWICEFGRINIREAASFESKVIDYVVYGDQLSVYEQQGDFTRIKYISPMTGEETTGYCYTAYISDTEPQGAQVYLNVPLFKQADYRWGAKKIGGYETLASAGCTTTCIAMVESYVNSTTIYPDAMVDQLPYTYDGLLTFPGRYAKYYGRDYLQVVVQKLHQGIPCLISGYTTTGKTHWVVIVGYNGDGETFAPENFQINDPGANRSTLTDFFRDYPLVEKIVYYAK